jgi:hypothetical protein
MTIMECTAHAGWPSYFIGYIKTTKRRLRKRAVEFNVFYIIYTLF